jgi:hypothetical protein
MGIPKILVAGLSLAALSGCVATQPATDTSNPVSPSASTTTPTVSTGPLAYTPDMQPIFASDCLPCHTGSRPLGNYSMASYAAVMRDVTPGGPSSILVQKTQPAGSMYRYFSIDRAGRSDMVKRWVVNDQAAQTR